ncbi:MAG: hypothetical protein ACLR6J_15280 [Parabacteroides merdae]
MPTRHVESPVWDRVSADLSVGSGEPRSTILTDVRRAADKHRILLAGACPTKA